ncbi:MAG: hypothetical protein JNL21_34105 [Myxococcales bacterium]|nr:hypothetical protein [Myxococcales bacterium]
MIRLGSRFAPPHLPPSSSGFSWWYADICGEAGEGLVLIWARNLPFVPSAAPGELSVALAVYKDGRERFYALQTAPGDAARAAPGSLEIGRSAFEVRQGPRGVSLRADLDIDVAGVGRVRGAVEVAGASARLPDGQHGSLDWAPITLAARGRAELTWSDGALAISGRAYFDGNASETPLDELGIRDWRWGRIALPRRDLVYFVLSPEEGVEDRTTVLEVDETGAGVPLAMTHAFDDGMPGWFGLRRASSLVLRGDAGELTVDFTHQVEDGPFYQRYVVEAVTSDGERGRGVAERVVPGRLRQSWHRPLVNMRVDRLGRKASMWLPLFAGASSGRVRRLVTSWLRGPREQEAYP